MIAAISGKLLRLNEQAAYVQVGGFEYEVLIPEVVRSRLQERIGSTIRLRTLYYVEGAPTGGRLTPRLLGFLEEAELRFFELFSSVNGLGPRKALHAMRLPVSRLARAIHERDTALLSSLPGIGKALAERIVAALRRNVEAFLSPVQALEAPQTGLPQSEIEAAFDALRQLGYGLSEARELLERALRSGQEFRDAQQLLRCVFSLARQS